MLPSRWTDRLVLGGATLVTLGVTLVFAGILAGPLFVPATLLVLTGLLALAAAGIAAVIQDRPPA